VVTGEDKRLLHEALVSAFYNVQLLREMVTYHCDQQLDHVTDGTLSSRATRSSSPRAPTAAIPVTACPSCGSASGAPGPWAPGFDRSRRRTAPCYVWSEVAQACAPREAG
jgi:hypothetical protein